MSKFQHFYLEIVVPDFDSELATYIINLDYLRRKRLVVSTHPIVFFIKKSLIKLKKSND